MKTHAEQSGWLRLLRTSAHLAIAVMWFIALAAYLPNLLELSLFNTNIDANMPQTSVEAAPIAIPSLAVVAAAIGGLLLIVLLFIVIKRFYIPATDKVVERMTETAQKQILISLEKRQPKLLKKDTQQISRYTIEAVYMLLIATPLLVLFIDKPIQSEVLRLLAEFILSVLALYSATALILFFTFVYRIRSKVK